MGTRGSALALAQATAVATALGGLRAETEIVPITTGGDRTQAPLGDKSRFVKEIEDALLAGEVDLAVHSAKDVPGRLPDGLTIAAVPAGEDPRDALVGTERAVDALPEGARVGTSSLRRRSQLLAINPGLDVVPLRGNVDTRLRKLADGEYDAVVLALAGLRRLGREDETGAALDVDRFVPAPGQGLLALETRVDDPAAPAVSALEDATARRRLEAERAVVEELDASCHTPVGAHACSDGDRIAVHAFVGLPDGSRWITDRLEAPADDPRGAGHELARRMLAVGAGELLREAEAVG
ncbi:MAG: hydroxymethylbilane synthase [Solirubrobacterales bacterium]